MKAGDLVQFIDEERMYRNVYEIIGESLDLDGKTKLYKITHTNPETQPKCYRHPLWVKEQDIVRV